MTFTLQDLKHLKIMAELEELPAAPVEEVCSVEKPVQMEDLTEKLLTLANRLRTSGFEKQADNLELRFVNYKSASVPIELLYNAHDETGEDLVDFAHPDGDVEMAVAKDHNGDVETCVSQHKKIVDIITEASDDGEPVKKNDILNMLKSSLNMKTAQENPIDTLYSEAQKNFKMFMQLDTNILKELDEDGDAHLARLNLIKSIIDRKAVYGKDLELLSLVRAVNYIREEYSPGFLSSRDDKTKWQNVITPLLDMAQKYAQAFDKTITDLISKENEAKTLQTKKQYDPELKAEPGASQAAEEPYNALIANFDKSLSAIDRKSNILNISKPEGFDKTIAWLTKAKNLLAADKAALMANQFKKDKEVIDLFTAKFNAKNEKLKAAGVY
jgi:hypothetical protein